MKTKRQFQILWAFVKNKTRNKPKKRELLEHSLRDLCIFELTVQHKQEHTRGGEGGGKDSGLGSLWSWKEVRRILEDASYGLGLDLDVLVIYYRFTASNWPKFCMKKGGVTNLEKNMEQETSDHTTAFDVSRRGRCGGGRATV